MIGSVLGPSSQRANECRIASFFAGIPEQVPVRTVNRWGGGRALGRAWFRLVGVVCDSEGGVGGWYEINASQRRNHRQSVPSLGQGIHGCSACLVPIKKWGRCALSGSVRIVFLEFSWSCALAAT